ncbi:MAG: class I SAM-dependent methyltransferase [Gemmatimonadales bacterium]|nr:class I SAM-dependent methyltransferase [Gemmatimonadales bacterium]
MTTPDVKTPDLTRPDYKQRFYERYYSSHVAGRDGSASARMLQGRARIYDAGWTLLFPPDRSAAILDVGCGPGDLLWWLQRRGYADAHGIDISPEQIRIARALGVAAVEEADLRSYLATRPAQFDRLILRDVLEHLTRDVAIETLDSCRAALRSGGRLIVQVPNAESPLWGRIRYGDVTHEMAFTESSLRQIFAVTGFGQVEFHPAGPVLRGPRDLPRHLLWKCVEVGYKLLVFAETGRAGAVVTESIIAVAATGA